MLLVLVGPGGVFGGVLFICRQAQAPHLVREADGRCCVRHLPSPRSAFRFDLVRGSRIRGSEGSTCIDSMSWGMFDWVGSGLFWFDLRVGYGCSVSEL